MYRLGHRTVTTVGCNRYQVWRLARHCSSSSSSSDNSSSGNRSEGVGVKKLSSDEQYFKNRALESRRLQKLKDFDPFDKYNIPIHSGGSQLEEDRGEIQAKNFSEFSEKSVDDSKTDLNSDKNQVGIGMQDSILQSQNVTSDFGSGLEKSEFTELRNRAENLSVRDRNDLDSEESKLKNVFPGKILDVSDVPGDDAVKREVVKRTRRIARSLVERDVAKRPAPKPAGNLAAYVNESPTLRNFVEMGVDLSRLETKKSSDIAEMIVRLDFERDVKPILQFLHRIGVPRDAVGEFITKNPYVFKESLDDLQIRVNYLESKRFDADAIGRIVHKAPFYLTTTTFKIDERLGYLQTQFRLTGDEVRDVVTRLPKIVTFPKITIEQAQLALKEFLQFSDMDMKQILLAQPKVYLTNRYKLISRGEYLTCDMEIPFERIVQWPNILRTREFVVKQRHQFLKQIRKNQYDPKLANYVTLKQLVGTDDVTFCRDIAKVPLKEFNTFMKST
ncbi:transcription termination factor 3, mitochondrial-like [Tubulanus polymorphus]|uniref:transcription termination factor 3, mitochondrial-like n=1 Tax=Tubulanus polymorphus TaxID=672921 RepID=UPI003DA606C1